MQNGIGMKRFLFMRDETEARYMLYTLAVVENGFQIFYHCLRKTQDICPGHRTLADDLESEGKSVRIQFTYMVH